MNTFVKLLMTDFIFQFAIDRLIDRVFLLENYYIYRTYWCLILVLISIHSYAYTHIGVFFLIICSHQYISHIIINYPDHSRWCIKVNCHHKKIKFGPSTPLLSKISSQVCTSSGVNLYHDNFIFYCPLTLLINVEKAS